MFGDDYYTGPRRYQTRVKNAQEAHEAIRPTDFRLAPEGPRARALDADELRIYELVWKRTMASQMPDARVLKTSVEITGPGTRRRGVRVHGEREGHRVRRIPPRVRRGQRRPGRRAGGPGIDPAGDEASAIGLRRRARTDAAAVALGGPRRRRGTRRSRRRGTPRPRSSRSWNRRASAGRRPTRRPSRPSSGAATCSARARRWCRASRRSP